MVVDYRDKLYFVLIQGRLSFLSKLICYRLYILCMGMSFFIDDALIPHRLSSHCLDDVASPRLKPFSRSNGHSRRAIASPPSYGGLWP